MGPFPAAGVPAEALRHEALLYAGDDGFLAQTTPFVLEALAAREPVLVMVSAPRIELMWKALGVDDDLLHFADMGEVGANPSLIIPAWRAFLAEQAAHPRVRGIGEPVWSGRSAPELEECSIHEALLNAALDGGPEMWLLCPYDVTSLDQSLLDDAARTHPYVRSGGDAAPSPTYAPGVATLEVALPEPGAVAATMAFDAHSRDALRSLASWHAAAAGVEVDRTANLLIALDELVDNSLRHGGGCGVLRVWQEAAHLVCEVRDAGRIADPLVGRSTPPSPSASGQGIWRVNNLCDLVQVRSSARGTTVRVRVRRG